MKTITYLLCSLLLLAVAGCDRESASRLAFNAVQGAGRQECMDTTIASQWGTCVKPDSYDDYQRKRQEVREADKRPLDMQIGKQADFKLQGKPNNGQVLRTE